MATLIVKNYEQALLAAKRQALQYFSFDVQDTNETDWLVRNSSTQCDCGETSAVRVVYFDAEGNQHYGLAGFCESCGEDY